MADFDAKKTEIPKIDPYTKMERERLERQARQAFSDLEKLILSHRKANVIPTLAASDILEAASLLLDAVIGLRDHNLLEEAPVLEKPMDK